MLSTTGVSGEGFVQPPIKKFDPETTEPQTFETPREFFEAMKAVVGNVKSSDILTDYKIKLQESGQPINVKIYDICVRSDFFKDSGAGLHQLEKMNGQVTIQKPSVGPIIDKGSA
nr:hypothetical protein [Parachlamydiaceae bacterium]